MFLAPGTLLSLRLHKKLNMHVGDMNINHCGAYGVQKPVHGLKGLRPDFEALKSLLQASSVCNVTQHEVPQQTLKQALNTVLSYHGIVSLLAYDVSESHAEKIFRIQRVWEELQRLRTCFKCFLFFFSSSQRTESYAGRDMTRQQDDVSFLQCTSWPWALSFLVFPRMHG